MSFRNERRERNSTVENENQVPELYVAQIVRGIERRKKSHGEFTEGS